MCLISITVSAGIEMAVSREMLPGFWIHVGFNAYRSTQM